MQRYLERIRALCPDLVASHVEANTDGQINDVLIVNHERVFRFPKGDWGRIALAKETKILELASRWVDMPLPIFERYEDETGPFVAYKLIPGKPLYRNEILVQEGPVQNRLAGQLGTFLYQLHSIPLAEVERHEIPRSDAMRTLDSWLGLYEEIKRELFPVMSAYTREWVARHFAPLCEGRLSLDYRAALIDGDIGPWHILYDQTARRITGIIDLGTGGIGDPALDLGVMVHVFGETFLRRMDRFYPRIGELVERARFFAGASELGWALNALRTKNPFWATVHLFSARDVLPVGSGWR